MADHSERGEGERACTGCGGQGCDLCEWSGKAHLHQHRWEMGAGVMFCVLCGADLQGEPDD